ncbi:MAG TPA: hypothetical protein PKB07_21005 [Flavilitoribacter sp.]|nr:hypothetical protein [Flavilitoribacter sp.]
MKNVLAISLLFLALVPAFQLNLIYSLYQVNKSYITRKYCINLDRPEVMCYGRCYVNKVIARTEDENTGFPSPSNQEKFSVFILSPIAAQPAPCPVDPGKGELPGVACLYSFGFNAEIFHPPRL